MMRQSRSSTRNIQIGIDPAFSLLLEATELNLKTLTESSVHRDSPTNIMYMAYCKQAIFQKSFSDFFERLHEKQMQLLLRQHLLEDELKKIALPSGEVRALYDNEFKEIAEISAELRLLEKRYKTIEKTFLHIQQQYLDNVAAFTNQYHQLKTALRKAFIDGGMSKFENQNIIHTLAFLCRLLGDDA